MKKVIALVAISTTMVFATDLKDVLNLCETSNTEFVEYACPNQTLYVDCEVLLESVSELDSNICEISYSGKVEMSFGGKGPGKIPGKAPKEKLTCNDKKAIANDNVEVARGDHRDLVFEKLDLIEEAREISNNAERANTIRSISNEYAPMIAKAKKEYDSKVQKYNYFVKKCAPVKKARKCRDYQSAEKRKACRVGARLVRGWNPYKVVETTPSPRVRRTKNPSKTRLNLVKPKQPAKQPTQGKI